MVKIGNDPPVPRGEGEDEYDALERWFKMTARRWLLVAIAVGTVGVYLCRFVHRHQWGQFLAPIAYPAAWLFNRHQALRPWLDGADGGCARTLAGHLGGLAALGLHIVAGILLLWLAYKLWVHWGDAEARQRRVYPAVISGRPNGYSISAPYSINRKPHAPPVAETPAPSPPPPAELDDVAG